MADQQQNDSAFQMGDVVSSKQISQKFTHGGGGRLNYTPMNNGAQSNDGIGLKWGFKDLERREPAWPENKDPIVIYNHTPELFQDWTIWVALFYMTSVMISTGLYAVGRDVAYAQFPDSTNFGHVFIRSFAVAGMVYFVTLAFARWTGARLNPYISITTTFNFILFGRNSDLHKRASVWYEFLKLALILLSQFVGFLIGSSLLALFFDTGAATSDCGVEFVAACDALPVINGSERAAIWREFFAGLLICLAFVLGETLHGDNRKKLPYNLAQLIALAYFLVHIVFGPVSGGSFNLFSWLVLAMYTNDYSNATVYTWSLFLGCLTVFIGQATHYWAANKVRAARKARPDKIV